MKLFSRNPLQKRILILVSCLVFLPYLALSFFIFSRYKNFNESKREQMVTSMLHIAELTVDHKLAQIENRIDSLTVADSVKAVFSGKNRNEKALSLLFDVPGDIAYSVGSLREYRAKIYLITEDESAFEQTDLFYHLSRFAGDTEFMEFVESGRFTAWLSPRTEQGLVPLRKDAEEPVLPFCRKVVDVSRVIGVVVCSVEMKDIFFEPLQELSQYGVVRVQNGTQTVYRMENGVVSTAAEAEASKSGKLFSTQNTRYPYRITLEVPNGDINLPLVFLLSFLAVLPLYLFFLALIIKSVNSLLKKLNLVSDLLLVIDPNRDHQRIPSLGDNEINALGNSINGLLSKVEAQRHELLESEHSRRQTERYTLQLQMNPHLLFNSLHWLGLNLSGENREVQRGVTLLGEIYRYNLTREAFASIGEELKNCETYVQMMRLLKDSSIHLRIVCPETLSAAGILRFTLQPIVENAIKHGLRPEAPLQIEIRIQAAEAGLTVTVSNDGRPISSDRLKELNDSFIRPAPSGTTGHIGLQNLAQRLHLTYGRKAALRIAVKDGFTVAAVCIPYEEQ